MKVVESYAPREPSIHVVPGRKGSWSVRTEAADETLSVHPSAAQAERAAQQLARRRGANQVIVHDRDCRSYTVFVEGARNED